MRSYYDDLADKFERGEASKDRMSITEREQVFVVLLRRAKLQAEVDARVEIKKRKVA